MALSAASLASDLESVFSDMSADGNKGDDGVFCAGLAQAAQGYLESAIVSVTSAGTHGSNAVAGSGQGSFSVSSGISAFEAALRAACETMAGMSDGGGDYLAQSTADALDALVSAGEVTAQITGTETTAAGVATAASWSETGGITCATAQGLASELKAAFSEMISAAMSAESDADLKGDDYLAQSIADAVHTYFSAGVVSTDGENGYTTSGAGGVS